MDQNSLDKSMKNEKEQKKKRKDKKLLKKLNINQKEKSGEQTAEQALEQAGAIDADLSDLENMKPAVDNIPDNSKQSPFGLEIVSDLTPVHQIQSKTLSSNFINMNNIKLNTQPQQVHRLTKKQNTVNRLAHPTMSPSQLLQVAKAMSPAMIYSVHQIASPDESGTRIQKFDSNLEDIDL